APPGGYPDGAHPVPHPPGRAAPDRRGFQRLEAPRREPVRGGPRPTRAVRRADRAPRPHLPGVDADPAHGSDLLPRHYPHRLRVPPQRRLAQRVGPRRALRLLRLLSRAALAAVNTRRRGHVIRRPFDFDVRVPLAMHTPSRLLGGEARVRALANAFYDAMD